MTRENPTRSDPIAPKQSSGQEERHRSAVAQTLNWAQETAGCEAVSDALEWLHTVGVVDGALGPDRLRTQASLALVLTERRYAFG